mmetsp:Transcript_139191/g.246020  ORF Transcript_139191/g.246020 Transcript_139191/m.246020 type:complete len:192 (-) Transcript_139191:138-713(-)
MAYGLRSISPKYRPNGSGRDWFFVGDPLYSSGRRTPGPQYQARIERMIPPLVQRKGPSEIQQTKNAHKYHKGGQRVSPAVLAAWHQVNSVQMSTSAGASTDRWYGSTVVDRQKKHEDEKGVTTPLLLHSASSPELRRSKGTWPHEYETTSSGHGRHMQGFDYRKLDKQDKYLTFSVKITDPARYAFLDNLS